MVSQIDMAVYRVYRPLCLINKVGLNFTKEERLRYWERWGCCPEGGSSATLRRSFFLLAPDVSREPRA